MNFQEDNYKFFWNWMIRIGVISVCAIPINQSEKSLIFTQVSKNFCAMEENHMKTDVDKLDTLTWCVYENVYLSSFKTSNPFFQFLFLPLMRLYRVVDYLQWRNVPVTSHYFCMLFLFVTDVTALSRRAPRGSWVHRQYAIN